MFQRQKTNNIKYFLVHLLYQLFFIQLDTITNISLLHIKNVPALCAYEQTLNSRTFIKNVFF